MKTRVEKSFLPHSNLIWFLFHFLSFRFLLRRRPSLSCVSGRPHTYTLSIPINMENLTTSISISHDLSSCVFIKLSDFHFSHLLSVPFRLWCDNLAHPKISRLFHSIEYSRWLPLQSLSPSSVSSDQQLSLFVFSRPRGKFTTSTTFRMPAFAYELLTQNLQTIINIHASGFASDPTLPPHCPTLLPVLSSYQQQT